MTSGGLEARVRIREMNWEAIYYYNPQGDLNHEVANIGKRRCL